jgi:putative ABC transport system substrate-binding protein
MRRRNFIKGIAGTVGAWPLAARAQQPEPKRRIAILVNTTKDDVIYQAGMTAFRKDLAQLGWTEGANVQIDVRFAETDADRVRNYAKEFVALSPDVILATGTPALAALQHATRTVPIVFVEVTDPVAAGFVDSLARPGGNITGFMNSEHSLSGKWLELLKQIVPGLRRAAIIRDAANSAGVAQFSVLQALAQSLGVEVRPVSVGDAGEIELAVAKLASAANSGLIVTPSATVSAQRDLIIALAARYKLPAVYGDRFRVAGGGLISYGPNRVDQFRRAAGYVDRILKGEKPTDLPVQAPTKYELVINLKTAKALGLDMPQSLLAGADEVIE